MITTPLSTAAPESAIKPTPAEIESGMPRNMSAKTPRAGSGALSRQEKSTANPTGNIRIAASGGAAGNQVNNIVNQIEMIRVNLMRLNRHAEFFLDESHQSEAAKGINNAVADQPHIIGQRLRRFTRQELLKNEALKRVFQFRFAH